MVETVTKEYWPIVYRKEYNVKFFGLEHLHPFDSKKWGHIYKVSIISNYPLYRPYSIHLNCYVKPICSIYNSFFY